MCMRRMKGLPDDTAENGRLKCNGAECHGVLQYWVTLSDVRHCTLTAAAHDRQHSAA